MDIIKVTRHNSAELLDRLRRVPLLQQPEILVYAEALITLEQIHPEALSPAQNYVWLDELKKVQELRWSLAEHGIDLFRLDGFVTYTVRGAKGAEENYQVYPPVVEESIEADGRVALLINDGMHRLYLARLGVGGAPGDLCPGGAQRISLLCLSPARGLGGHRFAAGQPGPQGVPQEMPPPTA
jgi:hypothetical protein